MPYARSAASTSREAWLMQVLFLTVSAFPGALSSSRLAPKSGHGGVYAGSLQNAEPATMRSSSTLTPGLAGRQPLRVPTIQAPDRLTSSAAAGTTLQSLEAPGGGGGAIPTNRFTMRCVGAARASASRAAPNRSDAVASRSPRTSFRLALAGRISSARSPAASVAGTEILPGAHAASERTPPIIVAAIAEHNFITA